MQTLITLFLGLSFFVTDPSLITSKVVDTESSTVTWNAYKVTGSHEGTIKLKNGELEFEGDKLVGGQFTIDMTTIACTGMKGGGAAKLEGHLKSANFFGVEKFPMSTFNITKVVSRGPAGAYKITGDLTIKDKTNQISFNAILDGNEATASTQIDRSQYDIKYGSGSFFDNLGDKTIYDEFDLTINLISK